MMEKFWNSRCWPTVALLTWIIVVHIHVFQNQAFFPLDDSLTVGVIDNLSHLGDFKFNKTIDLQPIRDLSYLIDYQISKWMGFKTYHISNLICYLLAICGINLLFSLVLNIRQKILFLLMMVMVSSPLYVVSINWLSARKHLLAWLFVIYSTYFFLKKRNLLSSIFFILSLLSQPINCLWPLWVIFHMYFVQKIKKFKEYIWPATLLILSGVWVLVTISYYYNDPQFSGYENVGLTYNYNTIASIPTMFGRYFFNLIWPYHTSLLYSVGSYENLVGLLALILFLFYLFKRHRNFETLSWLFFGILPLSTVTLHLVGVFVSDTYVLTTSVAFFMIVGIVFTNLEKMIKPWEKVFCLIMGIFIAASSISSYQDTKGWKNNQEILGKYAEREQSYFLWRLYTKELLLKNELGTAMNYIAFIHEFEEKNIKRTGSGFWNLFLGKVYHEKSIDNSKKIQILTSLPLPNHVYYNYYLTSLYASLGLKEKAIEFGQKSIGLLDERELNKEVLLAEIIWFCYSLKSESCVAQGSQKFKVLKDKGWNDSIFRERMSRTQIPASLLQELFVY